ncbi:MAG: hypothetical protein OXU20_34360 [Myxococcales bacterium]|nr:hypothetical protein [Myxococcales bacterium]
MRPIESHVLLAVIEHDRDFLMRLHDAGVVPKDEQELSPDHVEVARVAYTLVHDLEVNWAGVEVILHMRSELSATRRQVAELVRRLRQAQRG